MIMLLYNIFISQVYGFFFNVTATTEIYTYGHTLSLHDALPICLHSPRLPPSAGRGPARRCRAARLGEGAATSTPAPWSRAACALAARRRRSSTPPLQRPLDARHRRCDGKRHGGVENRRGCRRLQAAKGLVLDPLGHEGPLLEGNEHDDGEIGRAH